MRDDRIIGACTTRFRRRPDRSYRALTRGVAAAGRR